MDRHYKLHIKTMNSTEHTIYWIGFLETAHASKYNVILRLKYC